MFHLIDPREEDLDFSVRTRFRDIETGENITTEPWQIRKAYRNVVKEFQMTYMREMRRRNIDYVPLMTDQALDLALSRYLTKRRAIS